MTHPTDIATRRARPFTPNDLYGLTSPGEPQFDPAGSVLLYVVAGLDPETDSYRADLYVRSRDGAGRRLVRGQGRLRRPMFAPTGDAIAYIDGRPATRPQLWVVEVTGAAPPRQITEDGEVSDLTWSPDGSRIAYCALAPGVDPRARKIREFRRIPVAADGMGVLEPQGPSLYVIDLETTRVRMLAAGEFTYRHPIWSPDGREIAVTRVVHYSVAVSRGGELCVVSPDSGEIRVLAHDVNWQQPPALAWSPDSAALAYCTADPHVSGAAPRVVKVDRAGSSVAILSGRHDRFPCQGVVADTRPGAGSAGIAYSPDGSWVYYLAGDRGSVPLFRCAADGSGAWEQVSPASPQCIAEFSVARDGRIAYVSQTDTEPDQIWVSAGDHTPQRVTDIAEEYWSAFTRVPLTRFTVQVEGGPEAEAWIQLPAHGSDPPAAILSIHGGPHGMFGYCMVADIQGWLDEGWAVIQVNPPGSAGYGFDFARAVWGDWGGLDHRYQMAALDHCIAHGWVDPGRLAVTGTSYGGFVVNKIVARTGRFRCAVTENAPSDLISGFGTSDLGLLYDMPHVGGRPWRDPGKYLALSPIMSTPEVQTPILILAAEDDRRQPAGQSEEWFTALIVEGKEAVLVRYPHDSHFMRLTGRPSNRVHRLARVRAWFSHHLRSGNARDR